MLECYRLAAPGGLAMLEPSLFFEEAPAAPARFAAALARRLGWAQPAG